MSGPLDHLELEEPKYNKELWAMSLADLLSIVLSIFVLLFAISSTNQKKTEHAMDGVKGKFAQKNITRTKDAINLINNPATEMSASGTEEALKIYRANIRKVAKELLELEDIRIIEKGDVMILRVPVSQMFKGDTAEIEDRKQFMEKLADQLTTNVSNRDIDIEFMTGYVPSDDKEQKASKLAIARAGAFARKMEALGINERSIYAGVGDQEPDMMTIMTFFPRSDTNSSLVF